MLDGDLPPLVTRLLAAARLFALEKPGGGVRPIAIGDVLRRWVTRALCMQHKLDFEEEFRPPQFAVGTSAGGEKLFRAAQTYIQTQDAVGQDADGRPITRTLLSLDCRNAFNEIGRQHIIDELAVKHLAMVAFFWQFYGIAALLWYTMEDGRVETIHSRQGVQQGDAAGPFLFCLAFQPALRRLQEQFPAALVGGFMDDGLRGMDERDVPSFLTAADAEFRAINLVLRLDKCHAWSPHWRSAADLPTATISRGVRASTEGIILLSAPIGTPAFIERTVNKVVAKHQRLLDAVVAFAVDILGARSAGSEPAPSLLWVPSLSLLVPPSCPLLVALSGRPCT
ncbi:unnamed protein product [Vitrella brassicaformis CCMP3155]|uniref:Reverse transcriptase domain-containing protein n=1 Tax=Vitrella brassicaformis (strain CCMP3155) TaxID=1169540 RepID=A0A0G4GU28_VITBC|nr:unnamed protein product [Vitrella brassicaformis CCMP3155]|eukprot:CEM34278.1 unnamed protein product [Vitrella brassicaformis CCMP3155]